MNIVDSSGWIEYFGDGANADFFSKPILKQDELLVPVICLYEVFKKVMVEKNDEELALQAVIEMLSGEIIFIDTDLAIDAANMSIEHSLPMADSLIYATASKYQATLWT